MNNGIKKATAYPWLFLLLKVNYKKIKRTGLKYSVLIFFNYLDLRSGIRNINTKELASSIIG